MKNLGEGATEVSARDNLKEGLLFGKIIPSNFLESLRDLDQATPTRDAAVKNLELLEDLEVRDIFTKGEERQEYFNLLSLTNFHIGQQEAISGSPEAIRYFEAALLAARESSSEEGGEWIPYIEGTIAYLRDDEDEVFSALTRITDGVNKQIIRRFHNSLKKGKGIDYQRDYYM